MAKIKSAVKTLLDNDRVRVSESSWKPGTEGASMKRPTRVVRALKGGTLTRVFENGKTEKVERKSGEIYYMEADAVAHSLKNEGKSTVVLLNIFLK